MPLVAKLLVAEGRYWREVADAKRAIITRAMEECGPDIGRVASVLGVSKWTLRTAIHSLRIPTAPVRRGRRPVVTV